MLFSPICNIVAGNKFCPKPDFYERSNMDKQAIKSPPTTFEGPLFDHNASVLISGVFGNTSGVDMMKLKMTAPMYSEPTVDRIGTLKSLLRLSRFVA